jgi:hypothetical protein
MNIAKSQIVLLALLSLTGCGRYVKAVAPEMMAPGAVKNFTVAPMPNGLLFAFESSDADVRGKALKSLEGYNLYRKELLNEETSIFKRDGYVLLTTIQDKHLLALTQLREQARAQGKNPSKVAAPAHLRTFSFKDTSLVEGKTYAYRLVGFNQNGVEAEVDRMVRVEYAGDASKVDTLR